MRIKLLVFLILLCLISCNLDNGLLPTKSEIIKAAEAAGATNVVINSYMYADGRWENPSISTSGGFKIDYDRYVQVRVSYAGSVSNTAVETAIRQLFINNNFGSSYISVFANTTSLPQQPEIETYTLPSHQIITETVQEFGATSITIAAYTASGNNVAAAGGAARSNAAIVIRVNYSYNGLGIVIPSQAAVTLAIRNLFSDFTNVTASVSPTAIFLLPSHSSVITAADDQGATNVRILEYTANNEVIGEFFYGSRQSNTPIRISITYDIGANIILVQQAVRGLFQHFTDVVISTMLNPPTPEEIINALNNAGAGYVNIVSYTIAGSNFSAELRAINTAIQLVVYYNILSTSSNGQTAVRNLFTGFTNANIFVGNNIPILLPSESQIINAVNSVTDIDLVNINTYTVNNINASSLSYVSSSDDIVIRIRASRWVFTHWSGGWPQGYYQAIANNSIAANTARNRVIQLFFSMGFNPTIISIIFE